MKIFSGNAHPQLANNICKSLDQKLGSCDIGCFPDGETKVRILEDVRGLDVFIVQPTYKTPNNHLMELLIMIDAVKRSSARRITAVLPYYGYARQDRKHAGRVPITAKLVANILTAAGADRVLCMDLHATQIQGFFDIPTDHLFALPVFVEYLRRKEMIDPVVVSPDVGSVKAANALAKKINGTLAIVEKRRGSDTEVEMGHLIGDVKGREAIVFDDMIDTAGTASRAIQAIREAGASKVTMIATHGLFAGPAIERLAEAAPDEIIVTDTIPQEPKELPVVVLSVADLLAEAIDRIHRDKSVSLLFN